MENIEIIRDKSKLDGTGYFELSLGKYRRVHWEDTSLFFDEEVFGLIEPIFERHVPGYDHYDMMDADSNAWKRINEDLLTLKETLDNSNDINGILGHVGFVFSGSRDYFANHYDQCKSQLISLIEDLVNWSSDNIKQHGHIAVLGL